MVSTTQPQVAPRQGRPRIPRKVSELELHAQMCQHQRGQVLKAEPGEK